MAIQDWSEDIRVVDLQDDPQFTDELTNLMDSLESKASHVVLNFATVGFVNSSNVAKMLRLRKIMLSSRRRLMLCDVNTQVWGVFLVTGLEKIFNFTNDISTALATLQLTAGSEETDG